MDNLYEIYKEDLKNEKWSVVLDIINNGSSVSNRNEMHRAKCLLELGELENAQKTIDKVVEQDPLNPWAYRVKAEISCKQNDNKALLYSVKKMLSLTEESSHQILEKEAIVWLAKAGEFDKAAAILHQTKKMLGPTYLFRALYEAKKIHVIDERDPVSERQPIPKRIMQFWDKEPIPQGVAEQMDKWRLAYPDYEHVTYSEAAAIELAESSGDTYCADAIRKAAHPAQKSDIFRLYYLYKFGGIYIDADEAPSGDLRKVFERNAREHVLWLRTERFPQHKDLYCTNWFLASCSGSPIFQSALGEAIVNTMTNAHDKNVHLMTGPYMVSKHILNHIVTQGAEHCSFVTGKTGRELICQNVKWASNSFQVNTWQEYAGIT